MTARVLLGAAVVALLCSPAGAQQLCSTPVGVCAASGTPGAACGCFTAAGTVQGNVGPPASAAQSSPGLPHYCCTAEGKIGPLPNYGSHLSDKCSVITPKGVPMTGTACN
jgi:hypothetical protein